MHLVAAVDRPQKIKGEEVSRIRTNYLEKVITQFLLHAPNWMPIMGGKFVADNLTILHALILLVLYMLRPKAGQA
jgi:hypothetical protein